VCVCVCILANHILIYGVIMTSNELVRSRHPVKMFIVEQNNKIFEQFECHAQLLARIQPIETMGVTRDLHVKLDIHDTVLVQWYRA
jgi:hypothetical protein